MTSAGLIFTTANGGGTSTQSYAHTEDLPRNVWMELDVHWGWVTWYAATGRS